MTAVGRLLVVCVDDMKRTSVHVMLRASLCTGTCEAVSPVEVWSLCSPGSTCTETRGVDMNYELTPGCGVQ